MLPEAIQERGQDARGGALPGGEDTAARVLSRRQALALAAVAVAVAAGLALAARPVLVTLAVLALALATTASLHRLGLCLVGVRVTRGARGAPPVDRLNAASLPVYTILVPLYREATVVPGLLRAIKALDYPPDKLDVKLLLEPDDVETAAAVADFDLADPFEVLVVPEEGPKTKPKACNHGLAHARGKYVVIFDAEDRPEPGQLREALGTFAAAAPDGVCLQARLQFWNRTHNLLTRLFTFEYAAKFGLLLPGLERLDAPIPLGGTSNHFPVQVLRDVGGWDAYNVTEDLELGIRLACLGYRTGVIESTTWEEANSRLASWIRQRSRWLKGHIQTWLVLTRHPIRWLRELGVVNWLHAQLLTLGVFLPALLNPVFLAFALLWVLGAAGVLDPPLLPDGIYLWIVIQSVLGNAVFVTINVAGALRAGYRDLLPYALILPPYWQMSSIAVWRGLLQLIRRPSYWDKTPHGLVTEAEQPAATR